MGDFDNYDSYDVKYASNYVGESGPVRTTNSTSITIDTGYNKTYVAFKVRALKGNSKSGWSSTVGVTTD
jgi:hypothetical protein